MVPDLDPVIITTTDEKGLCRMEVDTSYWTLVLFETIVDRAHLVIPKLNATIVKRRSQQGQSRMKGNAFDPVRLGLELRHSMSISSVQLKLATLRQRMYQTHLCEHLHLHLVHLVRSKRWSESRLPLTCLPSS